MKADAQNQHSASIESLSVVNSATHKSSVMDYNFPLWTQIFQKTKIPAIILYPFMLLFFIQVLFMCTWPWTSYWQQNQNIQIINKIRTILFYVPHPAKESYYLNVSIIFISFNILSFVLMQIQLIYFKIQRKFICCLNYPIRLYFETILMAFMIPNLVIAGETFLLITFGNKSLKIIVSLVLSIINEIYMAYTFIGVQYLNSVSVFLDPSPLLNFDATFVSMITLSMHLTLIMYFLFEIFENWSHLVIIIMNIAFIIFVIIMILKYLYIVKTTSLTAFVGFCCGCISGDIFSVLSFFKPSIDKKIIFISIIAVNAICVVIFYFYFEIRKKKIVKRLSVIKETNEEYTNYYDSLNLTESSNKALTYLRVGFQNAAPCFYNLSLIKYISENYNTEKELKLCLYFANFFPKESRLQNELEKKLLNLRKLSFDSRFLIYQIQTIKMIRQFADNSHAKLKLLEMKNLSQQCEMMTKLGLECKFSNTYFENLSHMCMKTKALWKESLINHPNNPKLCEQYCRYLIEAESDFIESIKIKRRQEAIELGICFTVDDCFKSFVKTFPKYLTKEIVDTDGAIKQNPEYKQDENNSFTNKSTKTTYKQEECDSDTFRIEFDDHVGSSLIKFSRERIALQRLLNSHVPMPIKLIWKFVIAILLYVVFICGLGTFFAQRRINEHINNMKMLKYLSYSRFYGALSNICIMGQYFFEHNGLQKYVVKFRSYLETTDNPRPFIDMQKPIIPNIMNFTQYGSKYYMKLINHLTNQSIKGTNITNFASMLIQPHLNYNSFEKHCMISVTSLSSLASILSQMYATRRKLSGMNSFYNINHDPDVCELANNFFSQYLGSTQLYDDIGKHQQTDADKMKKYFKSYSLCVPFTTLVFCSLPMLILHFLTLITEYKLKRILKSIDLQARAEANESMMINSKETDLVITDFGGKRTMRTFLIMMHMIFSFYFFSIVMIGCLIFLKITDNLVKLNHWNKLSANRLALSAESLNTLMNTIIMKDIPEAYRPQTHPFFIKIAVFILQKYKEADDALIHGVNGSIPCQGFDEELDLLNIVNEKLTNNVTNPSLYYQHASIHEQIKIYNHYATEIIQDMMMNKTFKYETVVHSLFLSNYILFDRIYRASERINELSDNQYYNMFKYICVLAFFLIVGIIVCIAFEVAYYNNRISCYKSALFVIKRINPYVLLNNKNFSKMFLKQTESVGNEKPSMEGSIIKNANDSIICTNIHGIIEVANGATTHLLGYKPDQILGQSISSFFSNEYMEKINSIMDQMKNQQLSMHFEHDYSVVSDESKTIPVHYIIIGMKINNILNSFVFILKDESKLMAQQKIAEDEKAKSEKLLYQILPRDIVCQINKGIKDISFQVPSATIIFIDINKFSAYSSNLSPKDIMANLSYYFAKLDELAQNYNMITKIKLIGDIYMAACGLFNADCLPESHADQSIKFGLDVIEKLDEINRNLSSDLEVRIGINTGGPIIAGVLGTDKPAFDIIGDPINIAARLQSTCETNKVHISSSTQELVRKHPRYKIVQRGSTFLKGKGNQITYYITRAEQPQKSE